MRPTLPLVVIAGVSEAIRNRLKPLDGFVARAPLRRRFAFVAGSDGSAVS
jgi:hypothetical protein